MAISSIHITGIVSLATPFALDGSDYIPPETATEDFRTALREFLLAVPGLADLAGVYYGYAPANAAFPCLVVNRLWQQTIILTTHVYYKEAAYQLTVLSLDDEEAETLGDAAHAALLPVEEATPLAFTGGYEMTRFPGRARGPDAQPAGPVGGDRVWMYSFDYTWLIGLDDE